jgi:hypothetical protein
MTTNGNKKTCCVCFLLLAILVMAEASIFAQQKNSKTARKPVQKPGIVSGRVFAITQSGDIKPARMAKVYLFYSYRLQSSKVPDLNGHPEDQNPTLVWSREKLKALKEIRAALEKALASGAPSPPCLEQLLEYDKALIETLKCCQYERKADQIVFADADEEGNFKISVTPAGIYTLVARGRAGFNEALWQGGQITIDSGMETTVKLSAPEKSCLVVE